MSVLYRSIIRIGDKYVPQRLVPLWNHEAGPKTIFFWAPLFKWSLVVAGLKDMTRPAEKLSVSQSGALSVTGLIWSRYSMVIIPKNWSLFSVNMFVAFTGMFQLFRIFNYQRSLPAEPQPAAAWSEMNCAINILQESLRRATCNKNTLGVLCEELSFRYLLRYIYIYSFIAKKGGGSFLYRRVRKQFGGRGKEVNIKLKSFLGSTCIFSHSYFEKHTTQ